MPNIENTISIMQDLVSFPSVSTRPNLELVDWIKTYAIPFADHLSVIPGSNANCASLWLRIGPPKDGGLLLSGHLDVVPADVETFYGNPWEMRKEGDRFYGRGTADMKGFIACCLSLLPFWTKKSLQKPIYIALSHDEEIGAGNTPALLSDIKQSGARPDLVLIGEPTDMMIVDGHKATYGAITKIKGKPAHSSDPRAGVDANMAAASLLKWMQKQQSQMVEKGSEGSNFDPAYTTINAGTLSGGTARNIISDGAEIGWECRLMPDEDPDTFLEAVKSYCATDMAEDAGYGIEDLSTSTERLSYMPAFDPTFSPDMTLHVQGLLAAEKACVVPFATEAGFFQNIGWPTLVCGPGSINQAHKNNEFVDIHQLTQCLHALDTLALSSLEPTRSKMAVC
jgi:acetylornithine deacetylase